eukprot:570873_1
METNDDNGTPDKDEWGFDDAEHDTIDKDQTDNKTPDEPHKVEAPIDVIETGDANQMQNDDEKQVTQTDNETGDANHKEKQEAQAKEKDMSADEAPREDIVAQTNKEDKEDEDDWGDFDDTAQPSNEDHQCGTTLERCRYRGTHIK